jgi:hypothetical protein
VFAENVLISLKDSESMISSLLTKVCFLDCLELFQSVI